MNIITLAMTGSSINISGHALPPSLSLPFPSPSLSLSLFLFTHSLFLSQDIDGRGSVHEHIESTMDHLEFSGNIVPLMPFVITEPHFVSCTTNEGISQLHKTLYRIGVGSFRTTHLALLTIGIEVPTTYLQVSLRFNSLRFCDKYCGCACVCLTLPC